MTVSTQTASQNAESRPISPPPASVVAELGEGAFLVEQASNRLICRRAASCLLLPEPGDMVLLAPAGEDIYLLAVLERAAVTPGQWRFEGDAAIGSTGSLQLAAAHTLSLDGHAFTLRADDGEITVENLRYTGVLIQAAAGSLRLIGQACETIVDRITQLTKFSLRRVTQIDQVRAGQLDYEGADRVRIRGKYAAVTAKSLIKAKAKQVHIG